ncbi:MAG: autotransporter outer membrane beta-barrel domain-containing protein [Candidatus Methylumidiphilus sp.]
MANHSAQNKRPAAGRNPAPQIAGLLAVGMGCSALPASADIPSNIAGLKADQASLLSAFKHACPQAAGALALRCQQLQALNPAQQKQAIISLTPYQFLPQTGMPIRLWPKQVYDHSKQRLVEGYAPDAAASGGGSGGDTFRDGPLSLMFQAKYQAGGKHLPVGGFNADAYELTLGGDYRLSDELVVGAAFAYNHTETIMNQDAGSMRSNIYRVMLFGDYYLPNEMYVNWLGIYTDYDNDIQRRYGYSGFVGSASSNPDTRLFGLNATVGKNFNFDEWQLDPFVRLEYANLQVDAYREQAGQGLAYEASAQTDESLISVGGLQLSRVFSLSWGILTPSLRFEYEHQFLNDNRRFGLRLADAPAGTGLFFLNTGNPDRDYCNLGGSVAFGWAGGVSAFLHYETRLGQSNLSSQIVELGLRVPF